ERSGNTITSVLFFDGMERLLQTKRDAEVDDGSGTTRVGMAVSGRLEFDARGRLAAQGQPVFDQGPPSAFVDVPLKNPTRTEYDILSRARVITNPDGGPSLIDHGFAVLDGATFMRQPTTDAMNAAHQTLRTARYETRAVIERNHIGGQLRTLVTRYRFNPLSELTAVVDTNGNVTTSELDTVGRMVAM